ncbi:MAG: DUF2059 domain-containing protein [Terracidiphilus sp.]
MSCIVVLFGMGLALAPALLSAQATDAKPPAPAATAAAAPDAALPAIPLDQQPTNEQVAKLFAAMRLRDQLASVTKMMPNIMQQAMEEQLKQVAKDHPEVTSMTDDQKKAAQAIVKNYMEKVIGVYSSDDMVADMASVYKKNLSRSDVDGIIAFYMSPVGQHMLDRMPMMMKDSMNLVMEHLQERIKPVLDAFTGQMEELAKQSPPAAATPAPEKPAAK